ncbi:hypothetical protein [Streptomyces sp. NRRL S-350]|uniref:hypothetical protein n=1 Tax=Streptomyces sp. NRRL S-350 TaxID=1463902 RepID=UPI0004BF8EAD|nr:hypothetical protein [Streptomyces sp. NRRL S-350]
MTGSQLPRGITALIPSAPAPATPGERAASQLLHLRTAQVPLPLLAAAVELIAPQLESEDPVTREVAADVRSRLLAVLDDAVPRAASRPGTA